MNPDDIDTKNCELIHCCTLLIFDLNNKLKKDTRRDWLKAYEQLVSLDFDITAYTSVTYQRSSLLRFL